MKVLQCDNDINGKQRVYETDITDIHEAVAKFGRANDSIILVDDNGEVVGFASWPFGSKSYRYRHYKAKMEEIQNMITLRMEVNGGVL